MRVLGVFLVNPFCFRLQHLYWWSSASVLVLEFSTTWRRRSRTDELLSPSRSSLSP
jgi:hypothetical protein